MLRTRLWMGALLVAATVGALLLDERFAPWSPFLFALMLGLGLAACWELLRLLDGAHRPPAWLAYAAVAVLVASNWVPRVARVRDADAWHWVLLAFVAVVVVTFLAEMAAYRGPGGSVARLAHTAWLAAYLGLLPSFLAQTRWAWGAAALAMAIFVPKCCDIGAYFTGRFLGRRPMAPVLSPKKTWEGAAGGLAAAVAAALFIGMLGRVLERWWTAAVFGLLVGVAGMLGDLAESMIKRDRGFKDASHAVPGFGGVLDVVDSVIFSAPVAYCCLGIWSLARGP